MSLWRYVGASVRGTSHRQGDTPCQDAHRVHVTELPDGQPVLLVVVSDGAGSASHSQVGSERVCTFFIERIEQLLCNDGYELSALNGPNLVRGAALDLEAYADQHELQPRQLACTLVGAVVTGQQAFYLQVGDGVIVADSGEGLQPVFWPERGEYANETYFVANVPPNHIQWGQRSPPSRLALLTDGLQMLALDYATQAAHVPFFQRFFSVLTKQVIGENHEFKQAVGQLLDSDAINSRTDDDKTLVLAEYAGLSI